MGQRGILLECVQNGACETIFAVAERESRFLRWNLEGRRTLYVFSCRRSIKGALRSAVKKEVRRSILLECVQNGACETIFAVAERESRFLRWNLEGRRTLNVFICLRSMKGALQSAVKKKVRRGILLEWVQNGACETIFDGAERESRFLRWNLEGRHTLYVFICLRSMKGALRSAVKKKVRRGILLECVQNGTCETIFAVAERNALICIPWLAYCPWILETFSKTKNWTNIISENVSGKEVSETFPGSIRKGSFWKMFPDSIRKVSFWKFSDLYLLICIALKYYEGYIAQKVMPKIAPWLKFQFCSAYVRHPHETNPWQQRKIAPVRTRIYCAMCCSKKTFLASTPLQNCQQYWCREVRDMTINVSSL